MARPGVKRRLSQTLGQIKKGFAVDTFEGGFSIAQVIPTPANASATSVLGAVTLADGAETIISGGITNPDVFRTLSVKGNQASVYGDIEFVGKDWANRSIETTITASGSGIIDGLQPFKTIDTITFPARVNTGDTVSIGVTTYFGLYRPLAAGQTGLVLLEKEGGDTDTVSGFDSTYETFQPTTLPNGSRSYKAHYLTDVF